MVDEDLQRCRVAAEAITRRVLRSAVWEGKRCTWLVPIASPASVATGKAVLAPAGPNVYQGTTGIALFLTEAGRVLNIPDTAIAIEGALNNGLQSIRSLTEPSFYIGGVGLAYACARYGQWLRSPTFITAASDILEQLYRDDALVGSHGDDVIAGAAGAIPFLLRLSDSLQETSWRQLAVRLGYGLIDRARHWPQGWSWPSVSRGNARDLTGYAHGASGYAHAFLELYRNTADESFRSAAECAIGYERTAFRHEWSNWLDFRNGALEELLVTREGIATVAQRLQEGDHQMLYKPRAMIAWCHGAAGIAAVRHIAYDLMGDMACLAEAKSATALVSSAASRESGYSLCHGIFGNDECLLAAGAAPDLRTAMLARAAAAAERFECEGRPWPSGAIGGHPDPSFMLGDSGIAYHLIRLVDNETPSILIPIVAPPSLGQLAEAAMGEHTVGTGRMPSARQSAEGFAKTFWSDTVAARAMWPEPSKKSVALSDDEDGDKRPDQMYAIVMEELARCAGTPYGELLKEASAVERVVYNKMAVPWDFSALALLELVQLPTDGLDWHSEVFQTRCDVEVVEQWYRFERQLAQPHAVPTRLESPLYVLVYLRGGSVRRKPVEVLAARCLGACMSPRSVDDTCKLVFPGYVHGDAQAVALVLQQMKELHRAGLLLSRQETRWMPLANRMAL